MMRERERERERVYNCFIPIILEEEILSHLIKSWLSFNQNFSSQICAPNLAIMNHWLLKSFDNWLC